MGIPFSVDAFLEIFKTYNEAIYPAQGIAYILGLVAVLLLFRSSEWSDKTISSILAAFWLWMGGVYHISFFSAINPAAYIFGGFFILEGLLFLYFGVWKEKLTFRIRSGRPGIHEIMSLIFIGYAMVLYPILNQLLGHAWPYSPVFGLAPCPTTIFTFGVFLLSIQRLPVWLVIIPFLWSLVGFSAAVQLGVTEDFGLVIAGVVGLLMVLRRNRMVG